MTDAAWVKVTANDDGQACDLCGLPGEVDTEDADGATRHYCQSHALGLVAYFLFPRVSK